MFQSEGRRPEPYIATVRRYGVDLGFTEQTQLAWAVNAPNSRLGRGELAGSYGGVGANASVGVGGGGNFLVGGPANAYALQPISVQGQTGLNVAAGIADIQLQPFRLGAAAGITVIATPSRLSRCHADERGPRKRAFFVCDSRHSGAQCVPGISDVRLRIGHLGMTVESRPIRHRR